MNQKKLFLVIFCVILPLIQASKVQYCDRDKNYKVKVKSLDFPDPVKPGEDATFKITVHSDEPISGGKLVIDVTFLGLHVHKEIDEICGKTSCPISTGDFVISHSQYLPIFTPRGTYWLSMKINDDKNDELTCFKFSFKIASGSSVADS